MLHEINQLSVHLTTRQIIKHKVHDSFYQILCLMIMHELQKIVAEGFEDITVLTKCEEQTLYLLWCFRAKLRIEILTQNFRQRSGLLLYDLGFVFLGVKVSSL